MGKNISVNSQKGDFKYFKLSFSPDDVKVLKENAKDGEWLNLKIMKRKAPSDKGVTHYGVIDTWRPEPKRDEDI